MSLDPRRPQVPTSSAGSVLLVGDPTPQLERIGSQLREVRLDVMQAENICYAEMFATTHYFDAAILVDSIALQEQVSLVATMRICWPWMRIVRFEFDPLASPANVFDLIVTSEAELATSLLRLLPG